VPSLVQTALTGPVRPGDGRDGPIGRSVPVDHSLRSHPPETRRPDRLGRARLGSVGAMAGPRTRRRPLALLLAAVLVTVIVLIAQGGASSRPSAGQAVQSYLDQLRPGVQQTMVEGSDFADVKANAQTLGRDAIDRRLDRLAGEVQATLASVDSLTPPPTLRVAQAYLVAALGVRAKAVAEARPAFDAALTIEHSSDQGVGNAVSQLSTVAQDLGLGDRAFELFLSSVPPGSDVTPAPPWISDTTDWTPIQLTAFVDILRSTSTAQPVHDLVMLAFQTDPAAVSIAADGTETIPASQNTSVGMVVENVGNQTESNVTVYVTLTLDDGAPVAPLRDFISLTPGQTRGITLIPLVTDPGMRGVLRVQILPVPGQTDTTSNTIAVPVVFK
jgi:hypothetical protein